MSLEEYENSRQFLSLFDRPQFTLSQSEKDDILFTELLKLGLHHATNCQPYKRILDSRLWSEQRSLVDLPYLPVGLFKSNNLFSVPEKDIFKTMTSSGTTGQAVSRVILDRETAGLQSKALVSVMTRVLGNDRRPMIIIDSKSVIQDRTTFSARGAGVLGMMPLGRSHFYALNDNMQLDTNGLTVFLDKHAGKPILLFGFTFMVWKYFLKAIRDQGLEIDLSTGTLIHSGGWKTLTKESVGNVEFKNELKEVTGLKSVHNFYGMVEQVGSVFLEGDDGYLYPPNFAEVIIRNPETWDESPNGTPGIIQVLSVLPRSYPGHSLLTEDMGVVHGTGEPDSGWLGKRLEVLGRVPRAELRGCSDTHGVQVSQLAEVH